MMAASLEELLDTNGLWDFQAHLIKIGVTELVDLQYVTAQDLTGAGIPLIKARRLLTVADGNGPVSPQSPGSRPSPVVSPVPVQAPVPRPSPPVSPDKVFYSFQPNPERCGDLELWDGGSGLVNGPADDALSADDLVDLGVACIAASNTHGAESHLRRVLELEPHHSRACSHYCNVLKYHLLKGNGSTHTASNGETIEAVKDRAASGWVVREGAEFEAAVRGCALCMSGLVALYGPTRDVDTAQWLFELAIELDPQCALAYVNLGVLMCDERRDVDAAQGLYERAIELDPQCALAYVSLGVLMCDEQGNLDAAQGLYELAIEQDPQYVMAHISLGVLLCDVRRDVDAAQRQYELAIELDPQCALAYVNLGNLLCYERQDVDAAQRRYERAIKLDPRCALAHSNLGLLMQDERRDIAAAQWLLKRATELDPQSALAHVNLGLLMCYERGDIDAAQRLLEQATKLDPQSALAHHSLGSLMYTQRRDIRAAQWLYERAIELDPQYALAHDSLDILMRNNRQSSPKADFGLVSLEVLQLPGGGFGAEDRTYFTRAWRTAAFMSQMDLRNVAISTHPGQAAPALCSVMGKLHLGVVSVREVKQIVEGMFLGELRKRTVLALLAELPVKDICKVHKASRKDSTLPKIMVMMNAKIHLQTRRMHIVFKTDVPFVLSGFRDYIKQSLQGISW